MENLCQEILPCFKEFIKGSHAKGGERSVIDAVVDAVVVLFQDQTEKRFRCTGIKVFLKAGIKGALHPSTDTPKSLPQEREARLGAVKIVFPQNFYP
jgi:hypothetical protein